MAAVSLDRWLNLYLHRLGVLGRGEEALMRAVVRPGMTVADVGANHGLYTLLLSDLVGDSGRVIAFEPDPELFEALSVNCQRNRAGNVELHNVALGSERGEAMLWRSLLNAGDNRLGAGDRRETTRGVPVKVTTLDEVMGGQGVDFIKIDVQGWEWEVFRGMERVLAASPRLGIYFEYWPSGLAKAGCEPVALLNFLKERGFSIGEGPGRRSRPVDELSGFGRGFSGWRYKNLYAERGG
jgi:FkbM family methyltransferase